MQDNYLLYFKNYNFSYFAKKICVNINFLMFCNNYLYIIICEKDYMWGNKIKFYIYSLL